MGKIAAEQSSRNWGWIRTVGRSVETIPLALRADHLWSEIQKKIDVGFVQSGLAYLAQSDKERAKYQSWLDSVSEFELDAKMLTRKQIDRVLRIESSQEWNSALFSATDGVAEPAYATDAIANLAKDLGCKIYERCAVRGVDLVGGRAAGVVTEHGYVSANT